jgi:hypothetical protein
VLAPDRLSLRAVAGLSPARFTVAAPVPVLGTKSVLADADVPGIQIDVFPVKPERLPLAETERQGNDPPRAVSKLGRFDEQTLNLLDRVRLDVLFLEAWSLGNLSGVRGDMPAAYRLAQCHPDRAVHVVSGTRRAPRALHLPIEALQVFRLQALKPVGAQAGDEVNPNVDLVAVVRVLRDVGLGDVLDPVLKPALDRPALPGFRSFFASRDRSISRTALVTSALVLRSM